jgi:6,7-dimethyl-8-ribityllumazine synthase
VDALIGLGIIVQGETKHADLLAAESTRGLMDVQLQYKLPFAFEILWVDDIAHARARSEKGAEAAIAVLHSLAEKALMDS